MNQTENLMANSPWQVYGASCIGKSHIDNGLPNQDSIFFQQNEECLVAVVCDGAGSAKFSQDGANFFSQSIGQMLFELVNNDLNDNSQIKSIITQQLANIRETLQAKITQNNADNLTLRDYHTTFTAILVKHNNQALLVQIGDSPLITSKFAINKNQIDYFTNLQVSGDDSKNEYVNETHFITQDNWQDFLKIETINLAQVDSIALMSDGCADLVFEGASQTPQIYRPFFGNLLFNLCQSQTQAQGSAIIEQAISNPATYRLTGDDKSLVVLFKNQNQFKTLEPIVQVQPDNQSISQNNTANIWNTPNQASQSIQPNQVPSIQSHAINTFNNSASPVLPPSHTITDSTKQRRNTAVIAGAAMLIGTGVLGWINKDKFSPTQSAAITNSVASTVSSNTPANNIVQIESQSLEAPFTMDISKEITASNLNTSSNDLVLDVVIASPQGQSIISKTENKITNAKKSTAKDSQAPLLSLNIATLPVNKTRASRNTASSATSISQNPTASASQANLQLINHAIKLTPKIDCQPLNDLNHLLSIGIAHQPNTIYQTCHITLPMKAILTQIPALSKNTENLNSIDFEKGLSEIFNVQKSNNLVASQTQPASAPTVDSSSNNEIKLYYLSLKDANLTNPTVASSPINSSTTLPTTASTTKR